MKGESPKQKMNFWLLEEFIFEVPHFNILRKILKNPPIGRPNIAGYNWILIPAYIQIGGLKEFY